jgi:hypothetical protein
MRPRIELAECERPHFDLPDLNETIFLLIIALSVLNYKVFWFFKYFIVHRLRIYKIKNQTSYNLEWREYYVLG